MPAWLKTPLHLLGKLNMLDVDAAFAWHTLQLHCANNDSPRIAKRDVAGALSRRLPPKRLEVAIADLVRVGLLAEKGDEYEHLEWHQIPDAVWNDPTLRERDARRKRLTRDTELTARIKARDLNLCRYCGVRVRWGSQTAKDGGTYDHVDPDGPNSFNNCVVACRTCNGKKRDKTLAQAGLSLLAPGTTAAQLEAAARLGPAEPPGEPGSAGAEPPGEPHARTHARPDRAGPGRAPAQPVGPGSPPADDERARLDSLIGVGR